jgi:Uncharacterized alpha/beta hydrolase domain (DUF2235)
VPKNILIFADGTGNESGLLPDESRSNVYKLFRATRTGPDAPLFGEKSQGLITDYVCLLSTFPRSVCGRSPPPGFEVLRPARMSVRRRTAQDLVSNVLKTGMTKRTEIGLTVLAEI